ncbi:MAG TPA: phage holin [Clostridia bacterium]
MKKNNSVYRTYGFWMSLSAAILLVIQTILSRLGIQIDAPFVQEVISGILAVLVILGVIIKPKTDEEGDLKEFIQSEGAQDDSKPSTEE